MDQIVSIINALSSLIIVLVFAYIVVVAGIDTLQRNKQISMKTLAKKAHVQVCAEFGYDTRTPVSVGTLRQVLETLAAGHDPEIIYLASKDMVFNKEKIDGHS